MINLIPIIGDVLNKVLPDTKAKDKAMAEIELRKLEIESNIQNAITQQNLGQIEVNKIEASNSNLFVSGWRPFIGWTCGFALVWQFVLMPFLSWALSIFGIEVTAPVLSTSEISSIILGILGLSGMRSFEKKNNVQNLH